MNHSETIKNALSNQIVANVMSDQKLLSELVKKGFKGYDNMKLDELTNIFVDMFGWERYSETINEITSDFKNQKFIAYFDASYIPQTKEGYIAYVIKTMDDELVFRNAIKVNVRNIYIGESFALLQLLDKALELGINNIEIYGDNKNMIEKVNRRKGGLKGFNGYFPAIANRMDRFNDVTVTWNNREENKYADMLCKLKRKGVDVTKRGGVFDFAELLKISSKVGVAV